MLHEQAGDVLSVRRKRVVDGRWDQHLDDWLLRPTVKPGIEIGPVEVVECRSDNDARTVMRLAVASGAASEIRQLSESNIHAERAGAAFEPDEAGAQLRID